MQYKFTILPIAELETEDSYLWYESKKHGLGEEFFAELDEYYDAIKSNPNLFPIKYRNKRQAALKRFPFVVIYEVVSDEIVILSVFKTPRDPKNKPD